MKQRYTYNNVVNVAELAKIIKKADMIIWEKLPENKNFICDGHFYAVIDAVEIYADLYSALVSRLCGVIPAEGEAKEDTKGSGCRDRAPLAASFLKAEAQAVPVTFTGLKIDKSMFNASADVLLYKAVGCPIIWAVSETYSRLFCEGSIYAQKEARNSPLMFGPSENDHLFILTINTTGNSIIEKLLQDGIDTRLVVLEASYQTVHDRILARGEEESCWCMENIELARAGSASLPGIHIQTDGTCAEELCVELLKQMC